MRLIDADELDQRMYQNAFVSDSDMQKWDGGCWIRYRMFEKTLAKMPTVDAVPVVRCKDCANRGWEDECPLFESAYITGGGDEGSNFYCAWGERREDD